ncbi:hypothetical protein GCM10025868_09170 [Angustibacter aerolatus]|uniref:Enoyl-CoA hydratase n=1 Tax=Angustibacter aerolatus TaxID=1162965 RepID=A0ABQ6JFH9_9ACTN|nr:enoyl-CoA hydratase-related protein [Angustibacter aerolatus]GMA85667.1 hypothetical protein GCM10025868_09170 [Angustibacter aerolatus]
MQHVYEGFLRVLRTPLLTIAAVNGPAVGAGMNLALACDVRIASTAARFDTRFTRLRLHPGGGHTWLLERAVGHQQAVLAVLLGERWDAQQALQHGLVAQVTEPGDLLETAIALGARLDDVEPALARRVLATLRAAGEATSHAEVLAAETEAQRWSVTRPAFVEHVREPVRADQPALRASLARSGCRGQDTGPT